MSLPLQEHDYIGLSEVSPKGNSDINERSISKGLNLKATELRLGLPGSESPEREDVNLYGLNSLVSSGAKRVFSDTLNGGSEVDLVKNGGLFSPRSAEKVVEKKPQSSAAKAQVVGWPPIRSFRKNTMAISPPKNDNNADAKSGSSCIYVKVSMDGAPYLRKIDLTMYDSYSELSLGLKKMFSCFTIGQCGSHVIPARDKQSEGLLMDFLSGSEFVLTYEDKDGDWMLVGDVPWDMFIETCKRIRIMKSSDAVGLAPKGIEKCRDGN
ncbi:hypothetical protein DCAR_0830638 [Daucus carota subsp. sativus]|uniref:Auxin-responsive protein n=1 Tax=Daucus carota subsp. sativus TaxID=79200 RepID=A0A175YKW4_DAUCS|nr:PREDICTED: auxin-responsive protein IAA27-like [Daucus carota subsp. sativus]WOH11159.1 hypothetical protein DCAR_0830638 [Daucus carota subsp. sativus]